MVKESNSLFKPDCDVLETENYYYIIIDLPGVNPEEIDVSYKENKLEISGEKKKDFARDDGIIFHRAERRFGKFKIVFDWILTNIDEDNIDAKYKEGVLVLKIKRRNRE